MKRKYTDEIVLSLFWVSIIGLILNGKNSTWFPIIYNLALGVIPIYLWEKNNRDYETLGFQQRHFFKQILYGFALFILIITPIIIFYIINYDINIIYKDINDTKDVIVKIIIMVFVGFGEEVYFRGYLLNLIYMATSIKYITILATAVIFGLLHFIMHANLMQLIFTIVIGVIFAAARMYIKNCSLLSLILAHNLINCFTDLVRRFCRFYIKS